MSNESRITEPIIRLGVSSCLLGNEVRYDGGHKLDRYLVDTLGQFVEWVPICPEVEIGLPVPRETLRLIGDPDDPILIAPKSGTEYTRKMREWASKRLDELAEIGLHGFVFKKDRPAPGSSEFESTTAVGFPSGSALASFLGRL